MIQPDYDFSQFTPDQKEMTERQFSLKFIHPDIDKEVVPTVNSFELLSITKTHVELHINVENPEAASSDIAAPCEVQLQVEPPPATPDTAALALANSAPMSTP